MKIKNGKSLSLSQKHNFSINTIIFLIPFSRYGTDFVINLDK